MQEVTGAKSKKQQEQRAISNRNKEQEATGAGGKMQQDVTSEHCFVARKLSALIIRWRLVAKNCSCELF